MNPDRPDLTSFEATVAALFSRVRGHIEPGSHRMRLLLKQETLDCLQIIPTVLVAGTNGKGTLCSLLEQTFRDSNLKTALYTSPHLISPTERIRINGALMNENAFINESQQAFNRAKKHLPDATFFELITAIAFEYFARNKVDVLICEVGLGGRLDSTNVTSPTVSVLTSVGLDHTEWLGKDEKSIAHEKAYISRRNRTLLLGSMSAEAHEGVSAATRVTGAFTRYIGNCEQNADNSIALAQATIEEVSSSTGLAVHPSQVMESAKKHFWPGRFDRRIVNSVPVVFDAAHNSNGVTYFLKKAHLSCSHIPKPWTLVYASLADKDWKDSIVLLNQHFDAIVFTKTQSSRSVEADLLMSHACSIGVSCSLSSHNTVAKALESGLEHSRATNGTLFVLGSITLIGESFEHWEIPVLSNQE